MSERRATVTWGLNSAAVSASSRRKTPGRQPRLKRPNIGSCCLFLLLFLLAFFFFFYFFLVMERARTVLFRYGLCPTELPKRPPPQNDGIDG